MTVRTHLASMERRVIGFAIDFLILLAVVLVLTVAMDGEPYAAAITMTVALVLFVAYHWAGLSNRNYAIGRVITAITVISLRSGPELSTLQRIARPCIRLLWLLTGGLATGFTRQPMFLFLPLVIDTALLSFHPLRQTVTDMVCRTTVVNSPPLQPHRAPAAPMFSPDDAEFGPKPRKHFSSLLGLVNGDEECGRGQRETSGCDPEPVLRHSLSVSPERTSTSEFLIFLKTADPHEPHGTPTTFA
jgi:uncharacterized RDD family membrane protein YckC